jgi:hypothetical protein
MTPSIPPCSAGGVPTFSSRGGLAGSTADLPQTDGDRAPKVKYAVGGGGEGGTMCDSPHRERALCHYTFEAPGLSTPGT